MRPSTHSELLRVRVHPGLLERAREQAERRGMTISEYCRQALREQLEAACPPMRWSTGSNAAW